MRSDPAVTVLAISVDELKDLVRESVQAALGDVRGPDQVLAIDETRAAEMLSLKKHQLRDMRLRGEIACSYGPRHKPLYRLEDLKDWLLSQRIGK